jgi:hypothetical protein
MSGMQVRGMIRRARSAALATALADGWPYASLVTVAADTDGSPILLLSDLSDHSRNIAGDARVSLLVDEASRRRNPQTGARVSLQGCIERTDDARQRRRFLARHPTADLYAGFADFHIYRLRVMRAHLVAGFGRAGWIEGDEVIADGALALAVAADEEAIIAQLNTAQIDLVQRLAALRLDRVTAEARVTAVDVDGIDLCAGRDVVRIDFGRPLAAAREIVPRLQDVAGET